MGEAIKGRIERLIAKKGELLNKMKALRRHSGFNHEVRNAELKWKILNDEANVITTKIMELRGKEA